MAKLDEATRAVIRAALQGKRGAEAKAAIEDLATSLQVSRGYLYRLIQGHCAAPRRDRGQRKILLSESQWSALLKLTLDYDFAAEHAIRWAEDLGLIPVGVLSPTLYNQRLRSEQTTRHRTKIDTKPVRRFEASGPNILHQFDTTKLEELFVDEDDSVTWEPKRKKRNSRGEKAPSLWLYSLVDDYSRAKYARLYKLENQFNHFDFLYRAWSKKPDALHFPFYGLPSQLYMDRGPVNHAHKLTAAFKKLGVFVIPTPPSSAEPFGSRKRGKIERAFQDYAEFFKEVQVLGPLPLAELQDRLASFVVHLNTRIHRSTNTAPFSRWQQIRTPRETPSETLYDMLYHNRTERTVYPDLTFSIDGHTYRFPPTRPYVDWVKQKIEVYWRPRQYERVIAVRGYHEVELHELATVVPLSHNRTEFAQTTLQETRASLAGVEVRPQERRALAAPQTVAYLPKKGEQFDDTQIAAKTVAQPDGTQRPSFAPMRWLNKIEVRRELSALGLMSDAKLSDAERALLASLMHDRDTISEDELTTHLTRLRGDRARTGTEG